MPGTANASACGRRVLKNVVDWIVSPCGVPECAIHSVFSNSRPEGKKLVYEITREAFIKETLGDWGKGNDEWKDEQKEEDLQFLLDKHGLQNKELDTAAQHFRDGWCSLCNCSHGDGTLEDHFRVSHGWGVVSDAAKAALSTFEKDVEAEKESAHDEALARSAGRFELVAKGEDFLHPVALVPGSNNACPDNKYKCLDCGYEFRTNLDAMLRHSAEHDSGTIVCIHKNDAALNAGEFFRPSQHRLDRNTRRGHADGRFYCAIVPDKFKTVEGQLTCDQCDMCRIKFSEDWPSKQQAYAVAGFKRHYARFHLDQLAGEESQNEVQNGEENPQVDPSN